MSNGRSLPRKILYICVTINFVQDFSMDQTTIQSIEISAEYLAICIIDSNL
jgi:hypothetical protein